MLVREGQVSGRRPVELVVGSARSEVVVVEGEPSCDIVEVDGHDCALFIFSAKILRE